MNVQSNTVKICEAGREELEAFTQQLRAVQLSWTVPELVVLNQETEIFTAEFKVDFFHEGDLVDIFEFFICRNGALVVSEVEVRQWIRENVPDVIARHSSRL